MRSKQIENYFSNVVADLRELQEMQYSAIYFH